MRRVVVLPEPLGPRKPVTRPGSTVKERSSTASTGPKCLERPLISMGSPRVVAPGVIGATIARAVARFGHGVPRPAAAEVQVRQRGGAATLDELIGQQQAHRHGQLVVDPRHGGPAVDPTDQGRVPDVADHAGPVGEVGDVALADGPRNDALHQQGDLLLAPHRGRVRRGQRGEHCRHQLRLAAHGPQRAVQDIEDAVGRVLAPGRVLADARVEQLDPVHERGGEQVVLAREVAVDGAHGDVGPGGDVAHLDRLVAPLETQRHGGVDHALTPGLLGAGERAGQRLLHA